MNRIHCLPLLLWAILYPTKQAQAQLGTISTVAVGDYCNVAVDYAGNVYSALENRVVTFDRRGNAVLVAGEGHVYGEGGPATAAKLLSPRNVTFDSWGNMYIADAGYGVVRKVNPAGIITTVAGNYTLGPGYTGDGGPATSARVQCYRVSADNVGNIYVSDFLNGVIRKVNASGIITTVAGNRIGGYSGDGGPATNASIGIGGSTGYGGINADRYGNLYLSDPTNRVVRKVNSAGIITTCAGNGSTGTSGIGRLATAAAVDNPLGISTDAAGNLYIANWNNSVVTHVDSAGILRLDAGTFMPGYDGDGMSATTSSLNAASDVAIDHYGNIYIADCHNTRIRKVLLSYASGTFGADSFGVFVNNRCGSPTQFDIISKSYRAGCSVRCSFGDGNTAVFPLTASFSGSGYASFTHNYSTSGNYSIKAVLSNGTTAIDSTSYSYNHKMCNAFTAKFYYDDNYNCILDEHEHPCLQPILTEIDSNGIPLDTISATSGFHYIAYGNPSDVYAFRVLSGPPNITVTCPVSGVLYDSIQSTVDDTKSVDFGLECPGGTSYNLAVNAISSRTSATWQNGTIFVSNLGCIPTIATVRMYCSPKFLRFYSRSPYFIGSFGNMMEWQVLIDSRINTSIIKLDYSLAGALLAFGDTVQAYVTITPTEGDYDTSNNHQNHVDTARTGYDPNYVEVSPAWCFDTDTQFTYTVHFENTGNAPAENIYVIDTVSTEVVPGTMRIVSASAKMMVTKLADLPGQTVYKFDFPKIMLPDSSHHGECQGYVKYTIRTRPGLPIRSVVRNRAAIFFDYNDPVLTNTTETIKGCATLQVTTQELAEATITPNPVANELTITTATDQYHHCTITNTLGQVVLQQSLQAATTRLQVGQLPKGLYFVLLQGKTGNHVQKVIKL